MTIDRSDVAITAGRLSHRVEIHRKSTTFSDTNAEIIAWVLFAVVWAEIVPLSGREYLRAEQIQSPVMARGTIRTLAGITADMRLVYGATIYNIAAVLDDPRFVRHQTLMLSQGINQG